MLLSFRLCKVNCKTFDSIYQICDSDADFAKSYFSALKENVEWIRVNNYDFTKIINANYLFVFFLFKGKNI